MREFWLYNQTKNIYINLMSKDCYMNSPQSLGVEFQYSAYNTPYETGVYDGKPSFPSITLSLVVGNVSKDPYASFASLVKKLGNGDLYLYYFPFSKRFNPSTLTHPMQDETGLEGTCYIKHCQLTSVDKGQINTQSVLSVSVILTALTPWYEEAYFCKTDTHSDFTSVTRSWQQTIGGTRVSAAYPVIDLQSLINDSAPLSKDMSYSFILRITYSSSSTSNIPSIYAYNSSGTLLSLSKFDGTIYGSSNPFDSAFYYDSGYNTLLVSNSSTGTDYGHTLSSDSSGITRIDPNNCRYLYFGATAGKMIELTIRKVYSAI